jgi:hypothetical protein
MRPYFQHYSQHFKPIKPRPYVDPSLRAKDSGSRVEKRKGIMGAGKGAVDTVIGSGESEEKYKKQESLLKNAAMTESGARTGSRQRVKGERQ